MIRDSLLKVKKQKEKINETFKAFCGRLNNMESHDAVEILVNCIARECRNNRLSDRGKEIKYCAINYLIKANSTVGVDDVNRFIKFLSEQYTSIREIKAGAREQLKGNFSKLLGKR